MIAVTCEGCGKVIRAKDEHAGRRAKCPGCGTPIMIPAAAPPAAGTPQRAPATHSTAAPGVSSGGAARASSGRRGGARTSRGAVAGVSRARRMSSGGGPPRWVAPVAIGVVVLVVAIFAMRAFADRPAHETAMARGTDLLNEGRFEEARAAFAEIPEGHAQHAIAVEKIAELERLIAAESMRWQRKEADRLYSLVMALRKSHVDAVGPDHDCYSGNARYMLKRAQEFIDDFPADERATELRGLFSMYRNVASLDRPMTADDMRCEVALRMSVRDFTAALAVLAEYGALADADPAVVTEVKSQVAANAKIFWGEFREDMEREILVPGEENWTAVVNRISNQFLPRVEGLGTDVTGEARALLERAQRGG